MAVKKWSADRVFDGEKFLEPGTAIVVNETDEILDLVAPDAAGKDVRQLSGILTPGLINAHCHLELSHFKGQIPEGGGLVTFLLNVVAKRKEPWVPEFMQENIKAAAKEMWDNGIAGVADICNTTDAVAAKKRSGLYWHNLVEVLNFIDASLPARMAHNENVLECHLAEGLASSVLTPHAPYSVTSATFNALNNATEGKIISVHNQETRAENELFQRGTGDFLKLYELTGTPPLGHTGKSSLQTWLPLFTKGQTILLVHNTFTTQEDIRFANEYASRNGLKLIWCLCPGANWYIERAVPPLNLLLQENCTFVLGTDSYSSNWQLSIAAEIGLLTHAFPQVPLEILLRAATLDGAQALGWSHLGRLQKGLQPGLALLHTNDKGCLTGTSERMI